MFKPYLVALMAAALFYSVVPQAIAQDSGQQSGSTEQPAQPSNLGRRGHRHFDPAQRTQRLTKRLQLSSDQQSKVQEILTSEQSQMQNLRSDSSLSQPDRHAKMMEIHKTSNDQIRALLNPTQQQKWDAMQQKREERMRKHGRSGQPGQPSDSGNQPQ
jgi:protein CpxP